MKNKTRICPAFACGQCFFLLAHQHICLKQNRSFSLSLSPIVSTWFLRLCPSLSLPFPFQFWSGVFLVCLDDLKINFICFLRAREEIKENESATRTRERNKNHSKPIWIRSCARAWCVWYQNEKMTLCCWRRHRCPFRLNRITFFFAYFYIEFILIALIKLCMGPLISACCDCFAVYAIRKKTK